MNQNDIKNLLNYIPVISGDEVKVIGYEVVPDYPLLKYSLQDEDSLENMKLQYEQLFSLLMEEFNLLDTPPLLFLPVDANLLITDFGEFFLELLLGFEEKGLPLQNIIVQFQEQHFLGDLENLYYLTRYYKTYGIRIAIDGISKGISNLDRIRLISPDIMKIDLSTLKGQFTSGEEQDILLSLSSLARKIGATLLFNHISSDIHLYYAWRNNGRYYSGSFLHEPIKNMIESESCTLLFGREIQSFVKREKKKLYMLFEFEKKLNQLVNNNLDMNLKSDFDLILKKLSVILHEFSFRIYVVNSDGYQVSANYQKFNDTWSNYSDYIGRNWSWRPYFLENMLEMRFEGKGMLSDVYTDLATLRQLRTFSFPLDEANYLYVDLDPNYLYEHDALL